MTPGLWCLDCCSSRDCSQAPGGAQRAQRLELGLLVIDWGEHPEGGVAAPAVVERLDVLEHRGLELEPRWPAAAVDELLLERGEEGLGDGVVVGVAAGAHRDRDPGLPCGAAEGEADVLGALV